MSEEEDKKKKLEENRQNYQRQANFRTLLEGDISDIY